MFLSIGNISRAANIGMLSIESMATSLARLGGRAEIPSKDALRSHYGGARYLIRVTVSQLFVNYGRYIHTIQGRTLSPHVPNEFGRQPFSAWKRMDVVADSLNESDQRKVAAAGGPMPLVAYRSKESTDRSTTVDREHVGIWAASVVQRPRRCGHRAFADEAGVRSISTVAVKPATSRTPCGT
jgi:hypothetical protein